MKQIIIAGVTDQSSIYCEGNGRHYENYSDKGGYMTLPVLPFLAGQPWDNLALNLVHSLRPSAVRVATYAEGVKCDGKCWRVTVHLQKDNKTIGSIEQEVEVAGGTGSEMYDEIKKRGIILK